MLADNHGYTPDLLPGRRGFWRDIGVRENGGDDLVSLRQEEENGPRKDPEEGQVEEPADIPVQPPGVQLGGRVDRQPGLCDREFYGEVATIVGGGDKRAEQLFESSCIVIGNLTPQSESPDGGAVLDESLAPGFECVVVGLFELARCQNGRCAFEDSTTVSLLRALDELDEVLVSLLPWHSGERLGDLNVDKKISYPLLLFLAPLFVRFCVSTKELDEISWWVQGLLAHQLFKSILRRSIAGPDGVNFGVIARLTGLNRTRWSTV